MAIKTYSIIVLILSALSFSHAKDRSSNPPCLTLSEPFQNCQHISTKYGEPQAKNVEKVDWTNVVIYMDVYNNKKINELVEGHFDTWLKRPLKGLDIYFIADNDDTRKDDEILPLKKKAADVKSQILKSSSERVGNIRHKTIDSINKLWKIHRKDTQKKYFIKLGPDTFLLPENLLAYLNQLEQATASYNQPVFFGKAMCFYKPMCIASGGLYGMNRKALHSISLQYAKNPDVILENEHVLGSGSNSLIHEDFMISYAYNKATSYPIIHNPNIINENFGNDEGSDVTSPVSYHGVTEVRGFYDYSNLFYDKKGKMRNLELVVNLWKAKKKSFMYLYQEKLRVMHKKRFF